MPSGRSGFVSREPDSSGWLDAVHQKEQKQEALLHPLNTPNQPLVPNPPVPHPHAHPSTHDPGVSGMPPSSGSPSPLRHALTFHLNRLATRLLPLSAGDTSSSPSPSPSRLLSPSSSSSSSSSISLSPSSHPRSRISRTVSRAASASSHRAHRLRTRASSSAVACASATAGTPACRLCPTRSSAGGAETQRRFVLLPSGRLPPSPPRTRLRELVVERKSTMLGLRAAERRPTVSGRALVERRSTSSGRGVVVGVDSRSMMMMTTLGSGGMMMGLCGVAPGRGSVGGGGGVWAAAQGPGAGVRADMGGGWWLVGLVVGCGLVVVGCGLGGWLSEPAGSKRLGSRDVLEDGKVLFGRRGVGEGSRGRSEFKGEGQ